MCKNSNGRLIALAKFGHSDGACYTASTPDDAPNGDDVHSQGRSGLRLFENDSELGPAHSMHDKIVAEGGGRFSHWGRWVFFSTSDNTDPRTNGRTYTIVYLPQDDASTAVLTACLNVDLNSCSDQERYMWGERAFNVFMPDVRLSEYGRTMFTDADFLADYQRFDRSNYRSFDRKFAMKELLKLSLPLDGDVAECGVFRGASAYILAKAMANSAPEKILHLFDSFAGVSEPRREVDGNYWQRGSMASGLDEVATNLADHAGRIVFHPDWIPAKFCAVQDKQFCFVHIDVDLYQPTRDSLAFFGSRLVPGGLIVCDDYGFETCPGARKAMDEYAAATRRQVIHLPTGQGVIFMNAI